MGTACWRIFRRAVPFYVAFGVKPELSLLRSRIASKTAFHHDDQGAVRRLSGSQTRRCRRCVVLIEYSPPHLSIFKHPWEVGLVSVWRIAPMNESYASSPMSWTLSHPGMDLRDKK